MSGSRDGVCHLAPGSDAAVSHLRGLAVISQRLPGL